MGHETGKLVKNGKFIDREAIVILERLTIHLQFYPFPGGRALVRS